MLTIIAGGQTGVDRAALDAAIEMGIPYRGWCPKAGFAEDLPHPPGVLAFFAGLRETPHADPHQRSEWNVRDSDRLMVLVDGTGLAGSKGTVFAIDCAERLGKPHVVIGLDTEEAGARAAAFLSEGQGALALNIAGPRESEAPGIYVKARTLLRVVLKGRGQH